MHFAFVSFVLLWAPSFGQHLADEAIYTINGIKVLHTVNEKFVSFSIDPAVLLTGLNLSNTTLRMTRRLAPAFVRIAGPSTQFVKYQEENWSDPENGFIAVTPTMWFGINEWLASANLTPVFGINDAAMGKEGWDPQEAMEVLDLADKFNVSCYWQLGFDCTNKTEGQYTTDLKRLQHVLDAFPKRKNQWKVVGSDVRQCAVDPRKTLDELSDVVAAVILEQTPSENPFSTIIKPKVPTWVTTPKSSHHSSFASAISWAKEMGDAAKNGYEVILRQPRLHEIYSETPPFWVSALHKMLMGRNVLEAKTTINHPGLSLYAHCTKHQNEFIRSGAMTILVVNNCTSNHTVLVKFGTLLLKSTEVQSYVLTAETEDSTDVFLNGEKLNMDMLLNVVPKLRRARIMNYLSLFLPPKSVGFFVLPGAQIPVCASEEADMKLLMDEIREDQNINFSEEVAVTVNPRFAFHPPTLRDLKNVMEKELESDERYYQQKKKPKVQSGRNLLIQRAKGRINEDTKKSEVKFEEPKRVEFKYRPLKMEEPKKIFELELTNDEIRKVLADRAKVKAARKNIIFTSEEIEEIMNKATQKILKDKNTSIRVSTKEKRDTTRDKKDINMRLLKLKAVDRRKNLREALKNRPKLHTFPLNREKRDINMDLLKLKTEQFSKKKLRKQVKSKMKKEEEKQESEMVGSREKSEEEEEESLLPDKDVYAELAESDEYPSTTTEKNKVLKKPFNLRRITVPKIQVQPVTEDIKNHLTEDNDFEVNSNDDCDDFAYIHEFHKSKNEEDTRKDSSELWEAALEPTKPTVKSKSFEKEVKIKFKDVLGGSESDDADCMDYGELESDEITPVRLKRNLKNEDILGETYDPAKIKIDDDLKKQQFKMLKERLIQKKKLYFINKNNVIKRSIFQKNSFKDRYKSLTEGLKEWKPSDILTLKNPKKKMKRSVDHDVNSVENDIGEFINEWKKDGMIKPQVDMENGDYQLVFPNKDKIEVVENKGETEVKLVIHGDTMGPAQNTTKTNIQKIEKHHSDNFWKKLFRKVSKFFQGLSSKLKQCIMEDLLNNA